MWINYIHLWGNPLLMAKFLSIRYLILGGITHLFGIFKFSYRSDQKCGDTETLTGGLNHLMWFSVIIANLLMYKEQSECGILFALENHNKESLKARQEVIISIHLVKDRVSYSYIIPKKYLSNFLIKFPLLMDFPEGPNLCRCFTAIVTESFSYPWIFLLQLKLILSTLTILQKVNRSLQQLFKMLKTCFHAIPSIFSILYLSLQFTFFRSLISPVTLL